MVALADIKKDLPNFPDDVIHIWLLPLAQQPELGWPPPDPMGHHRWNYILGEKPLAWWRDVTWQLEQLDCGVNNLSRDTLRIINRMLDVQLEGGEPAKSAPDREQERFLGALRFIALNGVFPKPIVVTQVESGLSVLDGNHRIAAHTASQLMPDEELKKYGVERPAKEQQVWLGKPKNGDILAE